MLVEELIAQLQTYDPKLQVISAGYEGGYIDVGHVGLQKIALNVNDAWYYGPHESDTHYYVTENPEKYVIVEAVFLG